ncbi:hypothetical protein GCM10010221_26170 [Streptomyces parvus]|nr:hypothetical protein GCM10010221_26170 [Streptomyces parvus]
MKGVAGTAGWVRREVKSRIWLPATGIPSLGFPVTETPSNGKPEKSPNISTGRRGSEAPGDNGCPVHPPLL